MGLNRLWRDIAINGLLNGPVVPRSVRWRLLRVWGVTIPGWVSVAPGCWFGGKNIEIGPGTTVNYGCVFDNSAKIVVGPRCDVGHHVTFITSTHELGPRERRAGRAIGQPIQVEPGTWIGARATILPGVTIGAGCVIAAGAVVTSDCAPDGLYAGVPAVRKRDLA